MEFNLLCLNLNIAYDIHIQIKISIYYFAKINSIKLNKKFFLFYTLAYYTVLYTILSTSI